MSRLKMDQTTAAALTTVTSGAVSTNAMIGNLHVGGNLGTLPGTMMAATTTGSPQTMQGTQLLGTIDCYEDVFKEITKKLYGDEGGVTIADVLDPTGVAGLSGTQNIVYDAGDLFRQDVVNTGQLTGNAGGGLAFVAAPGSNGLPAGTILVQRRIQDDKGRISWAIEGLPQTTDQIQFATVASTDPPSLPVPSLPPPLPLQTPLPQMPPGTPLLEERWFESDELLSWTSSRIARYNPAQKVFRCVNCDFVGFLSRVAEHWLGNHADLRVFQCPRCPYTSAWARCVRMHLTRQHGETLADNSLWKENPVLEEVTKFLTTLKTKVEQKSEPVNPTGEKRYICPSCPYQTDRRDLYNRHENIHRDEKPFQCYVCDKQFNRADHVKKHFIRMHREHSYDINKIRKASASKTPTNIQFFNGSKLVKTPQRMELQSPRSAQVTQQGQGQGQQLDMGQMKQEMGDQMTPVLSLGPGVQAGISLTMQPNLSTGSTGVIPATTQQQLPHIAYFSAPPAPGQSGPLQGIPGVGGTKKEAKCNKGHRKKKSSEKMYTCSYCPWQGVDNWCLKRHLNTHIKPFLCALCDYKAARSERLATHVLKVHNKRVCHKCSHLADDSESLSQHIQDSHQNPLVKTGFNCNICQEYFELRADLEAHAILEHQKVIVQCDLCDFRTTDELSMEAHLREKHNLTPGMGAVAAAAAAAAAAAIGQTGNTQFQMQSQPQINISEQVTPAQLLTQAPGVITSNPLAEIPSTSNSSTYSPSPSLPPPSLKALPSSDIPGPSPGPEVAGSDREPETLCEKCGVDFTDEQSRKLHEKRHFLVNPADDDAVKNAKAVTVKRFVRTYVCSTCSYTCATKKMMMQHQRAHTGFELVCQAESCLFSTPFENTLKEHIQNEHGSESHVRCPHCGLRMTSSVTFTSHWRLHHATICSLCVNIYRARYDVKENDIHDVTCKNTSSSTSSTSLFPGESTSLLLKMESLSSVDFPGIPLSDHRLVDDLSNLMIPEPLDESPLLKKARLDIPSIPSSLETLYKRDSIRFLPRLVELKVVPLPPKIKPKSVSRRKRRRFLAHPPSNPPPSTSSSSSKTLSALLRRLQSWETWKRRELPRVTKNRRYCQRGTYSWLYRNPREGFKCFSVLCAESRCSWRFPRKVGLTLHRWWYHRLPRFKCDICGLQFVYLYQAFLHKVSRHDPQLRENQQEPENQVLVQVPAQLVQHPGRHFSQSQGASQLTPGQNPAILS